MKIHRNGKGCLMTRRQTVLRIVKLDLCDQVLFGSIVVKVVCHCQCHAAEIVERYVEGHP